VTGPKLYTMGQITGRLPGAELRSVIVSQKWHQTPAEHYRGRNVYWVAWDSSDIRTAGPHRLNLDRNKWESLAIGDPLERVFLPGDQRAYFREGIFASTGNLVIDLVLLLVEVGVTVWALVSIALELRERSQRPAV
jgi:hypothetical protein